MGEKDIERVERLFRHYLGPPFDRVGLVGLQSEVSAFLREFPQHSRLVSLSAAIAEVLGDGKE